MISFHPFLFEQVIFYFFVYSFFGWIIESLYISLENKQIINSGFLAGPFIPIYGIAAMIVITVDTVLEPYIPIGARLFLFMVIVSALEYYAGVLLEDLLGLKLWDYSDKPFNLNGKICLVFSLYWLALCFFLVVFVQRAVVTIAGLISFDVLMAINRLLGIYLLIDLVYSIRSLNAFKTFLSTIQDRYVPATAQNVQQAAASINRLVSSFPNLRRYVAERVAKVIGEQLRSTISEQLAKRGLLPRFKFKRPIPSARATALALANKEYVELVRDIIENPEFCRLKEFKHHQSSIWDHVHAVAYHVYSYCKKRPLDCRQAVRGALLHDFFLYDWRNGIRSDGPRVTLHAFEHPRIALCNAEKNFVLSDIERDIVLTHMWPVTLRPPRFKESLVVCFFDKYVALKELLLLRG